MVFLLPMPLEAQGVSAVTGRILDSANAPITTGSVRAPQLDRVVPVDSTGRFRIDGLATGRITIVGEAPGFVGRRVEITVPANGTVEQSFALVPNSHLLQTVEVRARTRRRLPLRLAEFEARRNRGTGGRFLSPEDLARFTGQPLVEALKTVTVGAKFQRSPTGKLTIISSRSLNMAAALNSRNTKTCGIQIWQDGQLLSDPNSQRQENLPTDDPRKALTTTIGADQEYDVANLLSNDYSAVEYYSDLASTPPSFRTSTQSCGVLVLWTRVPGDEAAGANTTGN